MPETTEPIVFRAAVAAGANVRRPGPRPDNSWGPWQEALPVENIDTSRLVGAPILLDHEARRSDLVVGVVKKAEKSGSGPRPWEWRVR